MGGSKHNGRGHCGFTWAGTALWALCCLLSGCVPAAYQYRVITRDCNCYEYRADDRDVSYFLHADYRMDHGIATEIGLRIENRSADTLTTGLASVKVSSVNAHYQYNNKFVPMPVVVIPPHASGSIRMSGRDISGSDDWRVIAGEKLTLTIKGILLGGNTLAQQEVVFVPENPKLKREPQ